jgi:hypothetical protein
LGGFARLQRGANLRRLRRRREAFAPDLYVRELIHDRIEAQDFLGWFKSSLRNENVFDSFWVCPLSTSLRISFRMSFCQLRLATERPKSVLKNGSSKRGTCESAIHHQLDRIDKESSDAKKSTALATSSGSPQRPAEPQKRRTSPT